MEPQDKITSQIKEAARNIESQAFPGMERVWEKVTERLDEKPENKVVPFSSYKKIAAAAAVLIMFGLGTAYWFAPKEHNPSIAQSNTTNTNIQPKQTSINTNETAIALVTNDVIKTPKIESRQTPKASKMYDSQTEISITENVVNPDMANGIEPSETIAPPAVHHNIEVITGKIVDKNGEGIPGATVKLLGAANGTQTDIDGNYKLEVITPKPTLEVNAIGYRYQNIFIDDNLNAGTVALSPGSNPSLSATTITMSNNPALKTEIYADSNGIVQNGSVKEITTTVEAMGYNNTQVTYGTSSTINVSKEVAKSQNGFTNSYNVPSQSYAAKGYTSHSNYYSSNNSANTVNDGGITNITKAVEGAAPGVQTTNGSGAPGANASSPVRGKGSLSNTTSPLVVVDGKIFSGEISAINPKNVAKMTILKDSTATSLYGSRGANGVIVIETKNGLKSSKAKKHP